MRAWSRAPAALALLLLLAPPGAARGQEPARPADAAFQRLVETVPGGRPVAFHFAARDSAIVAALAAVTRSHRPAPLARAALPRDTFHVVVAPTEDSFRELTGGRSPEWGLAIAFPSLRRVVVRSPRLTGGSGADPAIVLRHELNHLWLDVGTGGGDAVPRWFNEGFAALYAGEWRWVAPLRLAWGRWTGSLPPLPSLERSFPERPAPELAYIESMAAVRSLRDRSGERGMADLLARVRDGRTFDAALRETYGLTLAQFYASWEAELDDSYGWALALSDQRAPWVLLALAVVVFTLFRRRALKREIARRKRREDAVLGRPGDHSTGVEEWERSWEWEDDDWRGKNGDTNL